MSGDKRSVATDALETLGTIIDSTAGRDAIHLAVEPAVAGHTLRPGEDVGFLDDGTVGVCENPLGIVDPFLKTAVKKGEMFWFVVYPRKITSLRHVWAHPEFDTEREKPRPFPRPLNVKSLKRLAINQASEDSKLWLMRYAESVGVSYDELMEHAKEHAEEGGYWVEGGRFDGEYIPDAFWDHYEAVTDTKVNKEYRDNFFSCSC